MTAIPEVHEGYGGLITTRGNVRVVAHYGRPERTYRAVRNVAGVIDHGVGVLVVSKEQAREALDATFTNELPDRDAGVYGFVTVDGTITADAYVFDVGERVLALVSPGRTATVADTWNDAGATVETVTRAYSVFGVYGPEATEAIASVCSATPPETPLSIDRGAIQEAGVTVIRDDGQIGEPGYFLIASSDDAKTVFDALVNRGLSGAPLGYETWETLTLEAATPLFETDLRDADPAAVRVGNAFPPGEGFDLTDRRLVGFTASALPDSGATVFRDGDPVGTVTRCLESPERGDVIGFANLETAVEGDVALGEDRIAAAVADLPFVEGSERSARIPSP